MTACCTVFAHFFGFFGALEKGDFFWVHTKKVRTRTGAGTSFPSPAWERSFSKLRYKFNLRQIDEAQAELPAACDPKQELGTEGLFWGAPQKSRARPGLCIRPNGGVDFASAP
jgi:hypothetical protein